MYMLSLLIKNYEYSRESAYIQFIYMISTL